jgi:hypothetical protein
MRLGDPTFFALMAQRGPASDVLGDFNRDGMVDWAWIMPSQPDEDSGHLAMVLGAPTAGQVPPDSLRACETYQDEQLLADVRGPPHAGQPVARYSLVADFDGDGADDVVTVSRGGDILFRRGTGGAFEAPTIVNGPGTPRSRSRPAGVKCSSGRPARPRNRVEPEAALAALDLLGNTLSVYVRTSEGWQRSAGLPTGPMSLRIASGDLDGDGRPDLVVGNAYEGQLQLYRGTGRGQFRRWADVKVGITLSDVVVTDANGDGRLDVLVTDHVSGDVSVLINRGLGAGSVGFRDEAPRPAAAARRG